MASGLLSCPQGEAAAQSAASGTCLTAALRPQGTLTAQGKLLQQDTFYVVELDAGTPARPKERRVFLFEQLVLFSELLRKGSLTPGYMFKRSIKVRACPHRDKEEPNLGTRLPRRKRGMREEPEPGRAQPDNLWACKLSPCGKVTGERLS